MSQINIDNKKRVAKNTILLYIRMFIVMGIGIYTGRIVLDTLGVTDYGIYNVVGGIISIVAFFHSAITAASQRFISYELGKKDRGRLRTVFCTSVNIHLFVSVIIVILGETIGVWFVNTYLNIPESRLYAANWVFQASIFILVCKIMSVPYNSAIIAHEKMAAFAYISVIEVVLELASVFYLYITRCDKLITYSLLLLFIAFVIRMSYVVYCRINFSECKYSFCYDRQLVCQMLAYTGYSVMGSLGYVGRDQGINVLLNIFCGPSANAARGLGLLVSSKVNAFSHNFTTALTPQITKQYAAGNLQTSKDLVYTGNRLSFFLLSIISMPFLLNSDQILNVWLTKVPVYADIFLKLSLISSLIYSMSVCLSRAIEATGYIKIFQSGVFILLILELPFVWLLLKFGAPPYAIMLPTIISNVIAVFFRFFLIRHYLPIYNFREFLWAVFMRCTIVFILSYSVCSVICLYIKGSFLLLCLSSMLCLLFTALIIYFIGLKHSEKKYIIGIIKKHL